MTKIAKLIICLIFFSSTSYGQSNTIDILQKIDNWLTSIEITDGHIYKWPSTTNNSFINTGRSTGCAGVGEFYLYLYQITNNNLHLKKAKGAAEYIYSEYQNGNYNGHDYLDGAAAGGRYFLMLYNVCKEPKYLDYAIQTAAWLKRNAIYVGTEKCYWKHSPDFPKTYTGIAHGTAGVAYFFAELFEITRDDQYLSIIKKSINWINDHKILLGNNSISYKRLTTDSEDYALWCGGTTGIMTLFYKMYKLTSQNEYLDLYISCTEGLIASSFSDNNNRFWGYSSTDSYSLPLAYCHGVSSTATELLRAWKLTNNSKYNTCGIEGLNFLIKSKNTLSNGLIYYPHLKNYSYIETGYMTGQASIGKSFLEAYELTNDAQYLQYAKEIKSILLGMAEQNDTKIYWYNYTNIINNSTYPRQVSSSFYEGVAGIGIFFADLVKMENNTAIIETSTNRETNLLSQNYPNPFDDKTTISFTLKNASFVKLEILDYSGKKLVELISKQMCPGTYSFDWNANGYPTGVYHYRIITEDNMITKKMVLYR